MNDINPNVMTNQTFKVSGIKRQAVTNRKIIIFALQ